MPAVAAPSKVLVTGASGFLASHIIQNLLSEGYIVVGTVRSPSKGDYLANIYKSENFSYAIVPDIQKADAFDEVIKSNTFAAILHTASPFNMVADDPQELIRPAVQGTTAILKSAAEFGPSVKRVVITSSVAAIVSPKEKTPFTFTEEDWNEVSTAAVEKLGSKARPADKYNASKTLAERAAWAFVEEKKGSISFDLVTINPAYIFGPTFHEIKGVSGLNESNSMFLKAITDKNLPEVVCGSFVGNFVDVRNVSEAHKHALQKEEAAGQRFITSAGPYSRQDIYDALNKAGVQGIPKGYPGSQQLDKFNRQDGSKATRILGLQYLSFEETALATYNSLRERFPDAL